MNKSTTLLAVLESELTPCVLKLLVDTKLDYTFTCQFTNINSLLLTAPQQLVVFQPDRPIQSIHSLLKESSALHVELIIVAYEMSLLKCRQEQMYIWPRDAIRLSMRIQEIAGKYNYYTEVACKAMQEAKLGQTNDEMLLSRFYQYVSKSYGQKDLNLESIAVNVFSSPRPLQRKIKKILHCTPMEYVRMFRIEKAKELLLEEGASILSVSRQVGFSTPNYFSQIFKSVTGVKPSEYQQMNALANRMKRAS